LFALAGLFAAAQDTLEGSIPPEFLAPETRGTGFGTLGAVNGVGDLVASALVGTFWTAISPAAAFGSAAVMMLIGATLTGAVEAKAISSRR
jgi:MFS family permease